MLVSCDYKPPTPAAVLTNPYNFSDEDVRIASMSRENSNGAYDRLTAFGDDIVNPYDFSLDDTVYAQEELAIAWENYEIFQTALDSEEYSILDSIIPSPEQIDSGLAYWNQQLTEVTGTTIPYWQNQLELAVISQNDCWIELCQNMNMALGYHLALIDSTIQGLIADRELWPYPWETPREIVLRKKYREQLAIYYYSLIIVVIRNGVELVTGDYDGLGDFILSSEDINTGLLYWLQERDLVETERQPFWADEAIKADISQNEYWTTFVQHMRSCLAEYQVLIDSTIYNLRMDSTLVSNIMSESPESITQRKIELVSREIIYFGFLVDVLEEGMSLGIDTR